MSSPSISLSPAGERKRVGERACLLLSLLLTACAPLKPADAVCELTFTDRGSVRVLAVGHRVSLAETNYKEFEASFRRHLPQIRACRAEGRPTLVMFPEDSGLEAWFLGRDALFARGAGDTGTAFNLLYAGLWRQTDAYRARFPGISSARALTLALSDRAWRAMDETFSGIAKDAEVYVVTSANLPRARLSRDPKDAPFLDADGHWPAYVAEGPELLNAGLVYGPDGERLARTDKVYLTDSEENTLDLSNAALTELQVARLPFGVVGIAISRDAFYPPFTQRLEDLGAELVSQPEAFSGWTGEELPGDWLPEVILASSWNTTQKYPSTRFSAMPTLTGNVLSVVFDGQPWVTSQAVPAGPALALVGMDATPGMEGVGRWTYDEPSGSLEERRATLRELGAELLPGGKKAGQTVDSLTGADLELAGDGAMPMRSVGDDGTFELAPAPAGHQRNAVLARDAQGTFFTAWSDTRLGSEQIWFSSSSDDGATWSTAQPIAAGERQLRPAIAAGEANHVVVAWQELRAGREQVRLAEARDGATFTTRWVDEADGAQWEPAVTLAGDQPVVAWTDYRAGLTSFIRLRCGDAEPRFVDDSQRASTRATASQAQPALVGFSAAALTLAWIDLRDHNWHVRAASGALCDGAVDSQQLSAASEREVLAADPQLALAPDGSVLAAWDEIRDRRGRRDVAASKWSAGTWTAQPMPARVEHNRFRPAPLFAGGQWQLVVQDQQAVKNGLSTLRLDGSDPSRLDRTGAATNQLWQPKALGRVVLFLDDRSGFRRLRVLR